MPLSERAGDHLRRNAVAYVALFVALTGSAYAAQKITTRQIRRNAIVSKLIKDGEVKSGDIGDDAVTAADIANGTVGSADVADDALTGADIDESSLQLDLGLADGSVTTQKLADLAVTMPKLADAAVNASKLANDAVGSAKIADGSITDADVAATAGIDDAKLATINNAGKVADSALSSNVATRGANQTFTGQNTFQSNVTMDLFAGEGMTVDGTAAFDNSPFSDTTPFTISFTNASNLGFQHAMEIRNEATVNTGDTERLLELHNLDNDVIRTGINMLSDGAPIETGVDLSDPEINDAINIGNNDIRSQNTTISAAELNKLDGDPRRSVNLPIESFLDLGTPAPINFTPSDGTAPDFALAGGVPVIEYDDNTGAGADIGFIGTSFVVPRDFNGTPGFEVTVGKDGDSGILEQVSCAVSINGAAYGAAATSFIFGVSVQKRFLTPAGTYAAGDAVALRCRVTDQNGLGAQNDVVNIYAVNFDYDASV